MKKDELQKVPWFKIYNEHGSVEFLGPTDLTNCDLAKLVKITPTSVEVYPNELTKPARGDKLNKPAIITLLGGVKPKKGESAE